jgi:uncharacterized coiled-coil protein SlyX
MTQEQYLSDLANARLITIFELNQQVAELQAQVKQQQQEMCAMQDLIHQHPSWPPAQILKQYLWLKQENLI